MARGPKAQRVVAAKVNDGWQPGELANMNDKDVLSLLTDRKVVWLNSISGKTNEAVVRKPVITTANSGRKIVTFNTEEGFQSVALERL